MTEESEPRGELTVRTIAMPADTNANGDIFGGWVMSRMDQAGGIAGVERAQGRVVTVAVEAMHFIRPVRVGDVVKALLKVADNDDREIVYTAAGPVSSRTRVLNCDRLAGVLSWSPSTPLEDGLRETLAWWRANRTTWQR